MEELEKKEQEALYVIKEDLTKWLNSILTETISPDDFLSHLDTGIMLCNLAKIIQNVAKKGGSKEKEDKIKVPMNTIHCNSTAKKESFQARDNTANFITWCRDLGLDEAVIFESEGLVLHRDERRVILTLMELARVAGRLGMATPKLVELEKEIESLECGEGERVETTPNDEVIRVKGEGPPKPKRRKKDSLDEKVLDIFRQCTCDHRLQAVSYGCGKFQVTTPSGRTMILYVRILSEQAMVRVGGGWDTLEHFLLKYDPCRTGQTVLISVFNNEASSKKMVSIATPKSIRKVKQTSPYATPLQTTLKVPSQGIKKSNSTPSLSSVSSRKRKAD